MAAGVAAGILFDPKSGKQTRDQIANKSRQTMDKAQEMTKNTISQAKNKADQVATKTKAATREGKRAGCEGSNEPINNL